MTLDVLHPLVHSLSKAEKRYSRLELGKTTGETGFMYLFDCLLKHETPGEELTTALARRFPGATLEPARKHLYRMLMQALRQFEQDKRIDVRLGQLLHDSQLLHDRGLVQASQAVLTKVQRLALQYERSPYVVLAARQQIEQWVRAQFDGVDEPMLAAQHALIRQEADRSQTAWQHAALYETLLHRYRAFGVASQPADTLRLNDLLLEEYQLLNRQKQTSFAMRQQHLHFQSAYLRMIGDGAGSLRVYRELDGLFQENPTLWAEQPMYYVQLIDGILSDLRLLERFDEMHFYIDRLNGLVVSATGLSQVVRYQALVHSLLMHLDQGQLAEAQALVPDRSATAFLDFARELTQLPLLLRTTVQLALVRLAMRQGQLSAALHQLNQVLTLPMRSLPAGLATQSRLLYLLIQARLGNADHLVYALRSARRAMKSTGALARGEQFVLQLVQHWLDGKLSTKTLTQLDELANSPAQDQLLRDLDIRHWIRAFV
ncbi:hypothetical protein J2I47_17375 [Fibrella sp. HMF5335]|uniref:Uncharacterized protein n=1 Tax=Fibrella rubiginis TaxID=2817060 RepID=A0A939GHA9_9BACT|nr:hypothetical protein [Fibrella rubiginis]MBO0938326.1 hypothetical protein [Fibrella rubiginis]